MTDYAAELADKYADAFTLTCKTRGLSFKESQSLFVAINERLCNALLQYSAHCKREALKAAREREAS